MHSEELSEQKVEFRVTTAKCREKSSDLGVQRAEERRQSLDKHILSKKEHYMVFTKSTTPYRICAYFVITFFSFHTD